MKRPLIIGVMGGGQADEQSSQSAYQLGRLIARQGWVLLNGGRNCGIMNASARGATDAGGLTIGILPDAHTELASRHIRIPICTGMGSGRNIINILTSDIVVACKGGAGTLSEIALALKHGKRVITLGFDVNAALIDMLDPGFEVLKAESPEDVIRNIQTLCPQD